MFELSHALEQYRHVGINELTIIEVLDSKFKEIREFICIMFIMFSLPYD